MRLEGSFKVLLQEEQELVEVVTKKTPNSKTLPANLPIIGTKIQLRPLVLLKKRLFLIIRIFLEEGASKTDLKSWPSLNQSLKSNELERSPALHHKNPLHKNNTVPQQQELPQPQQHTNHPLINQSQNLSQSMNHPLPQHMNHPLLLRMSLLLLNLLRLLLLLLLLLPLLLLLLLSLLMRSLMRREDMKRDMKRDMLKEDMRKDMKKVMKRDMQRRDMPRKVLMKKLMKKQHLLPLGELVLVPLSMIMRAKMKVIFPSMLVMLSRCWMRVIHLDGGKVSSMERLVSSP
mmetsp:Transcript_36450/g.50111  ORF Transcript_36450/g.50111 Transcript_36450/m.50111 type:complete len:288 (-) Transcript_36450:15-878(-)